MPDEEYVKKIELPTILEQPLPAETLTTPATKILGVNPQQQAGTVGGWGIGNTELVTGTGTSQVGLSSEITAADDVRIWAGGSTPSSAPFRVTEAGQVVATNATITGSVSASSGTIGGWTINTSDLTGGSAQLSASGKLTLGTGEDVIIADAADATYRLVIGSTTYASAPFRVTKSGDVTVNSVTSTISAGLNSFASFTAGEDIAIRETVYFKAADSKIYKTDSDAAATTDTYLGFATAAISNGASGTIQMGGNLGGFSGLTAGSTYYLSGTAGAISTTQGTFVKRVGIATSTTNISIIKEDYQLDTLTTKGDLLTYGTALSRLGVGSNNLALIADSAQSLGIKWSPSPSQVIHLANTQDLTGASNVTFSSGSTPAQIFHSYADNLTASATYGCIVPLGATNISSIRILYMMTGGASDVILRLYFYTGLQRYDGSLEVTDVTDTVTSYTATGGNNKFRAITVPAAAYNGLTIQGGDSLTIQVNRDGNDAADTYNVAWRVYGIEFNFA